VPHDAGAVASAAERVMAGELPHRDFVDVYTGGLAFLNALAFKVFGIGLWSVRLTLFAAFVAWLPAVWYSARSVAGSRTAALVTVLAAASSVPVYPEGMPSWYNVFFATWGIAALFRYLDKPHRAWLLLAGVAGGLSILVKIVGLYYVAAGLLFLLHLENRAASQAGAPAPTAGDAPYRMAAFLACVLMGALAVGVVVGSSDTIGLLYFAIPPLSAVAYVAMALRRPSAQGAGRRLRTLAGLVAPFVLGVAIPTIVFVMPYVSSGSLGALWEGVFVLPRLRLDFAARGALPILGFLPAAAVAAFMLRRSDTKSTTGRVLAVVVGALVVAPVALSHLDIAYRLTWWTLTSMGPVLAIAALWLLPRFESETASSRTLLLLSVFGFCNLVQLPFAAPIYFLYAFPLLLLLAAGLSEPLQVTSRLWLQGGIALMLAFSLFRLDTGFLYHLGFRYRPHEQTESFEIERARGIRVTAREKGEYEELVRAVESLEAGPRILAFPDSPEVYFLTGKSNPTRTLFDFFEDPADRSEQILSLVDDLGLTVVVVNRAPQFSEPPDEALLQNLRERLGFTRDVGRFRIYWKGPA